MLTFTYIYVGGGYNLGLWGFYVKMFLVTFIFQSIICSYFLFFESISETCNWNSGVLRNRIWEMDGHVSFVVHTYYLFPNNTPVAWLGEADDRIFYSQINHYQWQWKSFLHLQLFVTLKECARFLAPVSGFNAFVPTAVWFLVQIAFNKADFSPVSVLSHSWRVKF